MKKEKYIMIITIGIVCFLLVLIIFMQFKVVYQTDITSIDTMREEDLKAELANWKSKYEEAEQKHAEVTKTLKKYQEESSSDSKTKSNLQKELAELELKLGLTDVEGEGLIITLEDPENIDEEEFDDENSKQRIVASELMIIANLLKDAGAEAISINNQRIVNKTDFAQITESGYIKINSHRVSAPFEIKVIGNKDDLKGSIIGTGYKGKIEKWGQKITFKESKKVNIKKYDGNMDTKYIE